MTFPFALATVVLACLSPDVASQQCRSGVTDEVKQSVREQLRQYQSGGENGTFPTVAVNCGQVYMSILSSCTNKSDISYLKTNRAFNVLIHSGKPNSFG